MLKPITNWSDLRAALEALGLDVYLCDACGHVWITSATDPPLRCPRRDCRVWANGQKRSAPGRPFETCPQCSAPDPKHPRKECRAPETPHAFHAGQ